jgi:hypothetical protein
MADHRVDARTKRLAAVLHATAGTSSGTAAAPVSHLNFAGTWCLLCCAGDPDINADRLKQGLSNGRPCQACARWVNRRCYPMFD